MRKSPDAFRTISEVADWLDVPTHVLRFWESRFSQIKPVKRAGGRRYYRPNDMLLIGGIKKLLHEDGMTIRGVQKLLREEGVRHVAAFSRPLDDLSAAAAIDVTPPDMPAPAEGESEVIQIVRDSAATAAPTPHFGSVRRDEPRLPFGDEDEDDQQRDAATPPPPDPAEITDPALAMRDAAEPGVPVSPGPEAADADLSGPAATPGEIPATPHVPLADPEDDAPRHLGPPSRAARLVAARGRIGGHADKLASIADRLRDIRDRLPR